MQDTTTKKTILGLVYLSAERYVVTLSVDRDKFKIFQIIFNKRDGSLHVSFPYFTHHEGILSVGTIPANATFPFDLSLVPAGKVTMHRVKYSHHVSGEALFSGDGKIRTEIRKQSVPLKHQIGHIFTVTIWGISSFEKSIMPKDQVSSDNRSILTFPFADMPNAVKFVGMWYSTRLIRKNYSGTTDRGPKLKLMSPNKTIREGVLLVNPFLDDGEKNALVLYCDKIPSEDKEEALTFMGGFDSPDIIRDHNHETKVLSLMYPAGDIENLKKEIGSIDFS